jgi:hypothetical protein
MFSTGSLSRQLADVLLPDLLNKVLRVVQVARERVKGEKELGLRTTVILLDFDVLNRLKGGKRVIYTGMEFRRVVQSRRLFQTSFLARG